MNGQQISQFNVVGISVRTSNKAGKASVDIPALWNKFLTEELAANIPGKINDSIYCIYTDYEKDHTKPYTTILGCKVESLDSIPVGMQGRVIEEGTYTKHVVKGNLLEGIVFNEWTKIWNSGMNRAFTADYEVYDQRAQNPENAEVDIFVAVK